MSESVLVAPEPALRLVEDRPAILVVEDDPSLSEVLRWRLERQGFAVLVARTARQGLALARTEQPALILLDLGLPDLDGLALAEQLYEGRDTCCIPVIVLSGRESADIVRRSRSAGCRFFVRKPYDPCALLVLIQHALA